MIDMKKLLLLFPVILLTSCFYRERVADYTIEGCENPNLFCTTDWTYDQGNDDSLYHKSFILTIKNNADYGIFLPKDVKKKSLASDVHCVDENGEKIYLSVVLKNNGKKFNVDLNKIEFEPLDVSDFYIEVHTPPIPSYEIEFHFKKNDGAVYIFSFKMEQEINHKLRIIPFELLAN